LQLESLKAVGLFGRFHHQIEFPGIDSDARNSSISILHGVNGIGKTTILRMMNGLLSTRRKLGGEFDPFRVVPFERFELTVSDTPSISVERIFIDDQKILKVSFDDRSALLNGELGTTGGINDVENDNLMNLIEEFTERTSELAFEYIEASDGRIQSSPTSWTGVQRGISDQSGYRIVLDNSAGEADEEEAKLASRVKRFLSAAQIDNRRFFTNAEPQLFDRVIQKLTNPTTEEIDPALLLERLKIVNSVDERAKTFGLVSDNWDLDQLSEVLNTDRGTGEANSTALTVIQEYVEGLETRSLERDLIVSRLETFQDVVNSFFEGKHVVVSAGHGLQILSHDEKHLRERDLSTGERQLLYLLVSALATTRTGTVIAIDEPEISLHISWKRRLIPALLQCSANAQPQFILASHSPDLAAEFRTQLIILNT
jgi:energy-coupling factor transporter ATP-binding protein EcfA2